jgi:hypothetical protein
VVAMSTQLGGAIVAALGAASAIFYGVAHRAVQRGESPPRLPDARTVGQQVRSRSARLRRPGPGSPGPRS